MLEDSSLEGNITGLYIIGGAGVWGGRGGGGGGGKGRGRGRGGGGGEGGGNM